MSWERYAKIGDEVVFIGDYPPVQVSVGCLFGMWKRKQITTHFLVPGEKYTITGFQPLKNVNGVEHIMLWLGGFRLRAFAYGLPFPPVWFRPLQKQKTDISALTALLNTEPVKETEDA